MLEFDYVHSGVCFHQDSDLDGRGIILSALQCLDIQILAIPGTTLAGRGRQQPF